MAGIEIFNAWGKIIKPMVNGVFNPNALAASV